MLPRLQAEDQLAAVNAHVIAARMQMEPADAKRIVGEWVRATEGSDAVPHAAPATPEGLAAIGIGTVIVPGPGEAANG